MTRPAIITTTSTTTITIITTATGPTTAQTTPELNLGRDRLVFLHTNCDESEEK
jgi:hypothetical protein